MRLAFSRAERNQRAGAGACVKLGRNIAVGLYVGQKRGVGDLRIGPALRADPRFAATGIKLTAAHGKLNLPAEYGLSWLLPRMIGLTRANDLLLTSRVFLAEEALAMGLVNAVVPPEELLPYTYHYVRTLITTVSPGSLRESKRQIYSDLHRDVRAAITDSVALVERLVTEPDFAEGVSAFVEKRLPQWGKQKKGVD